MLLVLNTAGNKTNFFFFFFSFTGINHSFTGENKSAFYSVNDEAQVKDNFFTWQKNFECAFQILPPNDEKQHVKAMLFLTRTLKIFQNV